MNRFNQKLFLENEIRQRFAKKVSWELNCCKILPGSGISDKFLNTVQEFLTNSSTWFKNFIAKTRPQIGAHPVWPNMDVRVFWTFIDTFFFCSFLKLRGVVTCSTNHRAMWCFVSCVQICVGYTS